MRITSKNWEIFFIIKIILINWLKISSTDIDDRTTEAIIQRCLSIRPDLLLPNQNKLTIKRSTVGLRPSRKSGIRVDGEWISKHLNFYKLYIIVNIKVIFFYYLASEKFGKRILICHNYGHGGSGNYWLFVLFSQPF